MSPVRLRLAELTRTTEFELSPDSTARKAIADRLGISAVKKLRFAGSVLPDAESDWRLEAKLGATVTQPCVVTLAPVTTRIDEMVIRRFLAMPSETAEGEEVEMPEDETVEPLPEVVDLSQVMEEALALALPEWPRAEGVEPLDISAAAPGIKPMSDDDAKPFSSLKSLKDKMSGGGSGSG
jgi:uncharacterized metal-binding protein YceD (DUF177 family)